MDIEYKSWVVTCPNKLIGKSKDEIEQEYWKAWEAVYRMSLELEYLNQLLCLKNMTLKEELESDTAIR